MQNSTRKPSQEDKILTLLRCRGLRWTPAPELSRISLQYCRAIATLRKQGHDIENRTETRDGVRHGFYRMAPSRAHTNLLHRPADALLFGLLPERHRDDA